MQKAQTGLEYLIILAAIIIIASVTVYLISENSSGNKGSFLFKTCQQAASQCKIMKSLNGTAFCSLCNMQCVDPITGLDIMTGLQPTDSTGAVGACKAGLVEDIFEGSS